MIRSLSTVVVTLALCACARDDSSAKLPKDAPVATSVTQDGGVRIVSVDSGVDLALVGDSISGGLSQQTLAKARQAIDTSGAKSSGFGASIERMVKSSVSSAIG